MNGGATFIFQARLIRATDTGSEAVVEVSIPVSASSADEAIRQGLLHAGRRLLPDLSGEPRRSEGGRLDWTDPTRAQDLS